MCSTCDYRHFSKIAIETNGRFTEKLEQGLGYGNLAIRCDVGGKNYVLAVTGEPKSEFRIYRCPTCGHTLFD